MAKLNGFLGKSCAGFAGRESAHGARANVQPYRARATEFTLQSAGERAAIRTMAFLGLAARLGKGTDSVRFALHN